MKSLEIKKDIFWLGAVDYNRRDFHGYSRSPEGTTYNAYLIKDKKNVLFDTVAAEFWPELLAGLESILAPERVDYLVVNHVELDHSACLPKIIACCKPEKIFCSAPGKRALDTHFNTTGWPIEVVKTGDVVNIGSRNIHFVETRMLHWPDSMVSYIAEDKLLICNDAFGQNIASTERFSDAIPRPKLLQLMTEYYQNIVLPYSSVVTKTLAAIGEMKLEIDMLAPDHGLIFRNKEEVAFAINTYLEFAAQKPQKRAVIFYDTMWQSTEKMAEAVAAGLLSVGVHSRTMSLKSCHHSEVMSELARCSAVLAGCPTHNNNLLPTMASMLTYMKGLRPQNKIGAAFGSYGWSGESVKLINAFFTDMGFELPSEGVRSLYVPKQEALDECFALGKKVGEALISKCDQ